MALSCSCDDDYADEFAWYWYGPEDFTHFKEKRRKRCVSCSKLIERDAEVLKFKRFRWTKNEIEERIYGNEKPLASWYLCEDCGGIWLSLADAGYECISPDKTLVALNEYWELTGFDPKKYEAKNE